MNPLSLFIVIGVIATLCFLIGKVIGQRIGYLQGRAEMASEAIHQVCLDLEGIEKELSACGKNATSSAVKRLT